MQPLKKSVVVGYIIFLLFAIIMYLIFVNKLVKDNVCKAMSVKITSGRNDPDIVIFTVFLQSRERFYIQSQTILNWAKNTSLVQPVLFVNNSTISNTLTVFAKQAGWIIVDAFETNNFGTPFLKPMFQYVLNNFKATFYAFANGDILFDDGLLVTLDCVKHNFNLTTPLLIVGSRWNFLYFKYALESIDPVWTKLGISKALPKARKFHSDAEDFFIVTKNYPWDKIKPVVIGRPGYDNYLVAMSNKLGLNTIDATNTLKVLHLNVNGSVYQGAHNKDGNYNKQIIGPFNYNKGTIGQSKYYTTYNSSAVCVKKRAT